MDNSYNDDRRYDLNKQLQDLNNHFEELDRYDRELSLIDEQFRYNGRKSRELNELLHDSYPHDMELSRLLTEHNETLKNMAKTEDILIADCRDAIVDERKKTEADREDCISEITMIEDMEREIGREDNIHTNDK